MKTRTFIPTALFAVLCLLNGAVLAAERLSFSKTPEKTLGASARLALPAYTQKTLDITLEALEIAQTDLNQDGTNEFILKPKDCGAAKPLCPYYITAETSQGFISLGTITAKTVLLGNDFSYGIRNLMVFSDIKNDFAYTIFVWYPPTATFVQRNTPS